ncbi:sensor histidine kinase [Amycolatopsis sp. DG1A-15b]|uniref:sensor histidine kinase n=1 Tax=Amycolatopsis sp. DG1A-15b TaxID=3052846 RepID=UPI00255BD78D|nr:sensor histidine kinase [Amycolatopsis sp. DG1A-15b]WIX90613.1 sensor domain-containing protein [Amycolatopsis sp. DG1A-15b]
MTSGSPVATMTRSLLRDGGLATLRGGALAVVAVTELVMFVVVVTAGSLIGVGVGPFMLPPAVLLMRSLTDRVRASAGAWSGVRIASPYLPEPAGSTPLRRCHHLLGDRANWRDALWLVVDSSVGILLTLTPLLLIAHGFRGLAMPFLVGSDAADWLGSWYVVIPVDDQPTAWFAAILGLAHFPLALWSAPHLLKLHARLAATLLSPTEVTRLTNRVQHLAESRDDAVGSQATELRRIERDLHDGAQTHLVAMGMTLDAAMRVLDSHPEAARSLMDEAKNSSAKALQQLRDLVRGIQPPVLVDRGIADAIRTLAIENPLRIETTIDLPGRPSLAVETAAYFSVSELLNNAMKHSGAHSGAINVHYESGRLVINVSDNGGGGANTEGGTGLRGIEKRLAPLDGFITILSPLGGPTMVTIEIPCGLAP